MALWWPSSTYAMLGAGTCPHDIGTGDFTVCAWVFPLNSDSLSGAHVIMDVRNGPLRFMLSQSSSQWGIFLSGTSYPADTLDFDVSAPLNRWSHLLATRRAGVLYGYTNGVQSATTHSDSTSISNNIVDIGAYAGTGTPLTMTAAAQFGLFAAGCSKSQAMEIASGTPAVDVVDRMRLWAPADADSYSGRLLAFGPGTPRYKPFFESNRPKWTGDGPYMMPRKRNVSAGGAAPPTESYYVIGGGCGGPSSVIGA